MHEKDFQLLTDIECVCKFVFSALNKFKKTIKLF